MDEQEARQLLADLIAPYRDVPYDELVRRFVIEKQVETTEVHGPSGQWYQTEVYGFWDDKKRRTIRVAACVDDGGWRAFHPMPEDFIKAPDDTFVGE